MVSQKSHTGYLLVGGLTLIGLLALVASSVAGDEREPAGSAERLQALLTERYEIRKKAVASLQKFVDSGRADIFDLSDAMTALYHAEADLCTTRADRIKVHEKLVETLKTHEGLAVRRADAGRMPEWELGRARAATLDARIDLERLRLGQRLTTK
jgi:outer membrane protein TolC